MLRSELSRPKRFPSRLRVPTNRAGLFLLFALTAVLSMVPLSSAQDFTLTAGPLSPDAVAPGGTSSINLTLGVVNGFTGTVSLTCQVTTTQTATSIPACAVSPATVTPSAGATATITTTDQTTPVSYSITITGTSTTPALTHTTPAQSLTVLAVTPGFTITVENPVLPASVPAGSGAQGKILVSPINGYITPTGKPGITLSCTTITPLVTIAPICSFDPQPVNLSGGPQVVTITISTFGPVITNGSLRPPPFRGLWLSLPIFAFVGIGSLVAGTRSRRLWGALALLLIGASIFLAPGCGNTGVVTTTDNGVTPNNTYTFTISGIDGAGVASSNATSTSSSPTVTLTVTSPTI